MPTAEADEGRSKWLGELPTHWAERRLSHVARSWTSNVDKHTVDGQPPVRLCNYTDVYRNETITSSIDFMKATATPDQIERFRLRFGDTLITKDSETADDIGVPAFVSYEADDLICGYHLALIRPDPSAVYPRFLFWAMASQPMARQWGVLAAGVTRVGLRSGEIARASVPVPPLPEQRAIADFLDRETGQIDRLIEKQEQLIDTLRERRVSCLEEATSTAEGEWIRLRYLFRPSSECNAPDEEVLSVYRDFGVIPKSSRTDNFNRTPENVERYLLVRPGDLVINRMKAWQGSLGVSQYRGIVSGDYEVVRPADQRLDPAFAHVYLRSPRMIAEYRLRSTGVRPAQWRLYWDEMGDIRMPVPDLGTQRRIVDNVDDQTGRIDHLIGRVERFIGLARERRAALVSAAVTGRIDVRGAV